MKFTALFVIFTAVLGSFCAVVQRRDAATIIRDLGELGGLCDTFTAKVGDYSSGFLSWLTKLPPVRDAAYAINAKLDVAKNSVDATPTVTADEAKAISAQAITLKGYVLKSLQTMDSKASIIRGDVPGFLLPQVLTVMMDMRTHAIALFEDLKKVPMVDIGDLEDVVQKTFDEVIKKFQ